MTGQEIWEYAGIEEINTVNRDALATIWCLTYNHEDYIRDAFEGFLSQQTDFSFQVLIFDDASTDKNPAVIKEYAQKYPEIFHVFLARRNTFSRPDRYVLNKKLLEENAAGRYVAMCEGDDYWVDPHKLQMQIDYMEKHPECSMTAHDAVIYDVERGNITKVMYPYEREKDLSMEELIMWYHGNVPTASLVYRGEFAVRKGIFAGTMESGDWASQLYCATKGKVHYFDKIMSCYRANVPNSYTRSVWNCNEKRYAVRIHQMYFLTLFDEYTKGAHKKFVKAKLYQTLGYLFDENRDSTIGQFRQMCETNRKEQDIRYNNFLLQLEEAFLQANDEMHCADFIKEFAGKQEHVLIMGYGDWGRMLAEAFEHHKLHFDGFVVSDGYKQEEEKYNKPVWELSKIPYDKGAYGMIVTVKYYNYLDAVENLERHGINKYIYLFDFIGE